ncbi:MAG: class A beta-lactamase-related serine hydrolase, partial [Chitinophagaceae bacterium]
MPLLQRFSGHLATLALLVCLGAAPLRAQRIQRIDGSNISAAGLDTAIARLMTAGKVSGMAITVFNSNKPVYERTFGLADVQRNIPLDRNTAMYGASFAKAVFAFIALQYVQEGLIRLDTPLVSYLPRPLPDYKIPGWNRGYQDLRNDLRYRRITARMCLTHTTGFPNWRWFEPDRKLKFRFDPGTRYAYSGEGIYLLQ